MVNSTGYLLKCRTLIKKGLKVRGEKNNMNDKLLHKYHTYYNHSNIPEIITIFSFDMTSNMIQWIVIGTTSFCFDCIS